MVSETADKRPMSKLWQSGLILSAAGFVGGLGNYAFQRIIGRHLALSEYGYVNSTMGFIGLLELPLTIASTSLVHYIAHFRAAEDEARLQGLFSGRQRFLLRLTIGGSLLAVVLVKPLSPFLFVAGVVGKLRQRLLSRHGLVQTDGVDRLVGRGLVEGPFRKRPNYLALEH
jgi:O-antigen/teichoic acid export membrane protein